MDKSRVLSTLLNASSQRESQLRSHAEHQLEQWQSQPQFHALLQVGLA
jgi:hypothetical protein